jgi:hypothetical protein
MKLLLVISALLYFIECSVFFTLGASEFGYTTNSNYQNKNKYLKSARKKKLLQFG